MKGWKEETGIVGRNGRTLWRCEVSLCAAHVGVKEGDDQRHQHDREFHLVTMTPGAAMDGYNLDLDGKRIGYVYKKRETYNLRRLIVSESWIAVLTGEPSIGGHDRLRNTMDDVLHHFDGAKAWGKGKAPQVWTWPMGARR